MTMTTKIIAGLALAAAAVGAQAEAFRFQITVSGELDGYPGTYVSSFELDFQTSGSDDGWYVGTPNNTDLGWDFTFYDVSAAWGLSADYGQVELSGGQVAWGQLVDLAGTTLTFGGGSATLNVDTHQGIWTLYGSATPLAVSSPSPVPEPAPASLLLAGLAALGLARRRAAR